MIYRLIQTLIFCGAVIIGCTTGIMAKEKANCITSKCHNTIGTKQFVHGPVGAGICTICHTQVPGEDHKFEYSADKQELCFGCHEERRDMMLEDHVHTPVAEGNCVGCHDPHQSDHRFQLKGKAADLCFQCHKEDAFSKEFVHGPVGAGDCNVCHSPHASANEKQLMSPKEDLCFNCHKDQLAIMSKRHIHPPVEDDCTNCHSPHSNDHKFMLSADKPDLCYECHPDLAQDAHADHPHHPVAEGQCEKCHNVHASDNPNMFLLPQSDLCFSCHEEMKEFVLSKAHRHGPVKDGDCNACHNPHGSSNARILRQYFPEEFYKKYETSNYALCFNCHNKDLALDKETSTLTDFRDGDRNLHFLHVNKEVKGRSCKACHQVHASNQEKHVRESVPYGTIDWDLPINYTKLDDGGKCVVGCHAPKEYHR